MRLAVPMLLLDDRNCWARWWREGLPFPPNYWTGSSGSKLTAACSGPCAGGEARFATGDGSGWSSQT